MNLKDQLYHSDDEYDQMAEHIRKQREKSELEQDEQWNDVPVQNVNDQEINQYQVKQQIAMKLNDQQNVTGCFQSIRTILSDIWRVLNLKMDKYHIFWEESIVYLIVSFHFIGIIRATILVAFQLLFSQAMIKFSSDYYNYSKKSKEVQISADDIKKPKLVELLFIVYYNLDNIVSIMALIMVSPIYLQRNEMVVHNQVGLSTTYEFQPVCTYNMSFQSCLPLVLFGIMLYKDISICFAKFIVFLMNCGLIALVVIQSLYISGKGNSPWIYTQQDMITQLNYYPGVDIGDDKMQWLNNFLFTFGLVRFSRHYNFQIRIFKKYNQFILFIYMIGMAIAMQPLVMFQMFPNDISNMNVSSTIKWQIIAFMIVFFLYMRFNLVRKKTESVMEQYNKCFKNIVGLVNMLIPLIIVLGFGSAIGRVHSQSNYYEQQVKFVRVFLGFNLGLQLVFGFCIFVYPMYLWINTMYDKFSKVVKYIMTIIVCSMYLAYFIISVSLFFKVLPSYKTG